MQLVYEEQDLFGDYLLINYTKLVKDSNELCIVCQVDETEDDSNLIGINLYVTILPTQDV